MNSRFLIPCVALAMGGLRAEVPTVTYTTQLPSSSANAKDFRLRDRANALGLKVGAGDLDGADRDAAQLQAEYERDFNPKLKQYVFQSPQEFDEFSKGSSDNFEWIDWGYAICLKTHAYILSERQDYAAAVVSLRKMELVVPMSAETQSEEGYADNRLKHFQDAVGAYQHALALTEKYPSQKYVRGLALRGIGFAWGELGRYDDASKAYRESLTIEPNNKLAMNELRYIEHMHQVAASTH